MGLQEDGSTYCLSRWPPLPYFHLLEDNGHGCCDDTVELKALCPHSEFHWESHQLHLDHRTSTRSPVKGKAWGWGHRTSFLFLFFLPMTSIIAHCHSQWIQRVWLWIGLHLFICSNICLFVLSSITQTLLMRVWQIFEEWCLWPLSSDIFKITQIGLEVGVLRCLSILDIMPIILHTDDLKSLRGHVVSFSLPRLRVALQSEIKMTCLLPHCHLLMLCWSGGLLPDERWLQSPGQAVCIPPWLRWCPSSHYRQNPSAYDHQRPSTPPHGLLNELYHQLAAPGHPLD